MVITATSGLRRRKVSTVCGRESKTKAVHSLESQKSHEAVQNIDTVVDRMFERWTCVLSDRKQPTLSTSTETEARITLELTETLLYRDEQSNSYNRRMDVRKILFFLTGIFCLMVPILLLFDLLLSFVPYTEVLDVLLYASQESSIVGRLAYVCVGILRLASFAHSANEASNGAVGWSSLCILLFLLCLIRFTTSPKPVFSQEVRTKIMQVQTLINEALNKDTDGSE